MDFSRGYTSSFRAVMLDSSWAERDEIPDVYSISITRDITSDSPLVDSADIEMDVPAVGEGYIRIYMDATQDSCTESFPIGTFLIESSGGEYGANSEWSTAELWSVLKPAEERKLLAGWYAAKGSNAAKESGKLISACIEPDVSVSSGSQSLSEHHVSDGSKSYLGMAWSLLPETWSIFTDGMGNVSIGMKSEDPVRIRESEIIGNVSESWDVSGTPNRVTVTDDSGNEISVVNDDADSETSTKSRGRIIDGDASGTRNSGESPRAFARRLLREQSRFTRTCTYDREFRTDVNVGTTVSIPGKSGAWTVVGQSITCGCGATVSETARRIEETWH